MSRYNELKNKLKYIIKYCRENKEDYFNVDNYNIKIIKGNLIFNDIIYRITQNYDLYYMHSLYIISLNKFPFSDEDRNKDLIYCIDKIYNILNYRESILTALTEELNKIKITQTQRKRVKI